MKTFVALLCLCAVAAAIPVESENKDYLRSLPAISHKEVHDEHGQYRLEYSTAEGTVVSERGWLVPSKDGKAYVMVFEGEVSYVSDDGKTYVTKYSAGLDGTHVQGDHLPVSVVEPKKVR